MDYALIFIFFFIGAGFHIMQKIGALREKFPTLTPRTVWQTFFGEEWNVLIVSVLCLVLIEVLHFVVVYKEVQLSPFASKWWFLYALALTIGYAGQRIVYKYLGSAEAALTRKAESIPGGKTVITEKDTPEAHVTTIESTEVKPKQNTDEKN